MAYPEWFFDMVTKAAGALEGAEPGSIVMGAPDDPIMLAWEQMQSVGWERMRLIGGEPLPEGGLSKTSKIATLEVPA